LPATFARSEQPFAEFETARGVGRPEVDGTITVTIQVRNVTNRKAQKTVVTDTLNEGLEYEWNSAVTNNHDARVVGTNPYRFEIGDMNSGEERILTYRVLRRKQ